MVCLSQLFVRINLCGVWHGACYASTCGIMGWIVTQRVKHLGSTMDTNGKLSANFLQDCHWR